MSEFMYVQFPSGMFNSGNSDECYKPLNISLSHALGMALGDKLFEESGEITGLKITKVHPIEGVTTEVVSLQKLEVKEGIQAAKVLAQV
jgi:hypothetical protein